MPNDKKDRRPNDATSPGLSRRNFIAFAAGLTAAATGTASDREQRVIDMDTDVKTPDGICDAVVIHAGRGADPGARLPRTCWSIQIGQASRPRQTPVNS